MKMLLANLPSYERKLYQLAFFSSAVALILGLLIGAVGAGESLVERADNWRASELPQSADTLVDFTAIAAQPRWFSEGGQLMVSSSTSNTGEPESFRLLGIVNKGGKHRALFLPPASESESRRLVQLGAGDTLIGDWQIKEITTAKVLVAQGEKVRELPLYGDKVDWSPQVKSSTVKHKSGATEKTPRSADSKAIPGNAKAKSGDKPKVQDKAKPKKDKAELDKARVERQEQKAKVKAAAAKQKAERDSSAKHKTQ
jgi:hypothetical protein